MEQRKIIYWSGTGNTEAMARLIAEGVKAAGKEPQVLSVEETAPEAVKEDTVFALGCPSMGAEQLEETVMEPFMEALEGEIQGKKIGLFGSYGWGDGEWMRNWAERLEAAGAQVIGEKGIICCGEPDEETEAACLALGTALAEIN